MSTVRVVTFNTLFGGHSDSGFGPGERWDGQMEFLRSRRADILALQFSGRSQPRAVQPATA
ncbi:hypothetical protein ACZ90_67390 [Streptomyces albus subsp. albus]|nr:hypothetical protein ACZ90_67390 [Streptomyces albus subsp. albus]